jgi:hypothetical protein
MNPVYFETRFRTDALPTAWPEEFAILSAYASTGESWTQARNEAADRELAAVLAARGGWHVRIVGYSPTTGHAEPSWATEMSFDEACDLGLRFLQDAIFHVKGNVLSVSYCDDRRSLVPVGRFSARVDGP